MATQSMRDIINCLTEAAAPKPSRDDLNKRRGTEIIRRMPVVADTPKGLWIKVDPQLIELNSSSPMLDLMNNPQLAGDIRSISGYTHSREIYFIPDDVKPAVVSKHPAASAPAGDKLVTALSTWTMAEDTFLSLINPLADALGDIDIITDHRFMKNRQGQFDTVKRVLADEGTTITLPSGASAVSVSPDWIKRAAWYLRWMEITTTYATRKPDRYFLLYTDSGGSTPNLSVAVFKDHQQLGISGKRMTKVKQAQLSKELAAAIGANAIAAVIKPNSNFHKMLHYVAANPGSSRSGWFVHYLGNDPQGMQDFQKSPDGMAAKMGFITARDPGRKTSTYQLRITSQGQQALAQLDSGQAINIGDYL